MNRIPKILTLAFLAVAAVAVGTQAPSSAQADREAAMQAYGPKHPCCVPTVKKIVTGQPGWLVKTPTGVNPNPAVIVSSPNSAWSTIQGTQWIANVANAGYGGQPGGTYVYSYHLGCLCPGVPGLALPATLTVSTFADDDVTVKLNGVPIAQHSGGWGFTGTATGATITSVDFQPQCDNVISFEVPNWDGGGPGSPTGLDASVSVSGYFQDLPIGAKCPICKAAATPIRSEVLRRGH